MAVKRIPISAVVITKNEEQQIADCINSLKLVTDDIIVVDSGSTDNTIFIAKSLGARVFEREWKGYSDQKNYGNEQANCNFILSIDADERIDRTLADSIKLEMQNPSNKAYEFSFLTAWEGKLIKFGGWIPDRHVRLFDKAKIHWGSKGVHEQLMLKDLPVKRLGGLVFHYTANSKMQYRNKMTRYAEEFAANNKFQNKYFPFWKKYVSSLSRFLKDYIFKLGFMEGKAGWEIVCEEVRYTFLKYKWSEQ